MLHDASARLQRDIGLLGGDTFVPDVDSLRLRGRAEAFGAAYVILGSQLGGQVLRPAVARDLGISENALTYFAGPKEVGSAWRSFGEALGEWQGHASDELNDVTVRSAVNLFGAFARAFSREGLDAL